MDSGGRVTAASRDVAAPAPVTPDDVLSTFTRCQPLFTALGDGRRQAIIVLLLRAGAARGVGEIAVALGLSQPAVSHHLKILRDARLLTVERRGTQRRYGLNESAYAAVLAPLGALAAQMSGCAPVVHGDGG
jgi:ArsR family transcriptional regulator, arsenate/arsenite/antimonite-responsive transcriptional repressor